MINLNYFMQLVSLVWQSVAQPAPDTVSSITYSCIKHSTDSHHIQYSWEKRTTWLRLIHPHTVPPYKPLTPLWLLCVPLCTLYVLLKHCKASFVTIASIPLYITISIVLPFKRFLLNVYISMVWISPLSTTTPHIVPLYLIRLLVLYIPIK